MSPSNELQLTFVVKLQIRAYVPPTLMANFEREFAGSPFARRHGLVFYLANQIAERGIPVCTHLFTTSPIGQEVDYSGAWNFDLRYEGRDGEEEEVFDLDLRSRILTFNDLSYTSDDHFPGALEEVGHVIQALNNCKVSFRINRRCGLHVFVGLRRKSGSACRSKITAEVFTLDTLQKFCGLVTAANPCINAMLAMHRVHSDYHTTPSETTGLLSKDVRTRINLIQSTSSVANLIELMNPRSGRNFAYNFSHLLRNASGRDRNFAAGTIEFRQHESTLIPQEISGWLQVVAGTVRLALKHDTNERVFNWALPAEGGHFNFQNFLEKIGKAHLVGLYSQKINILYEHHGVDPPPVPYRDSVRPPTELPTTPTDKCLGGRLVRALSRGRRSESRGKSKEAKGSKALPARAGSSAKEKEKKEKAGSRREKSGKEPRQYY